MPNPKDDAKLLWQGLKDFFKFSKVEVKDHVDDWHFDIVDSVLGYGLHNILWYIIQAGLVVFATYLLFRHISLENLFYTVVLWFVLKYLFKLIFPK